MNRNPSTLRFVYIVLALVLLLGLVSPLVPVSAAPTGPTLLKDIKLGGDSWPSGSYVYKGVTFFTATGSTGRGLWRTDGTPEGTRMVVDTNSMGDDTRPNNTSINRLDIEVAGSGEYLYFIAFNQFGMGLWRTHVTSGATKQIRNFFEVLPSSSSCGGTPVTKPQDLNGILFFLAATKETGCELWKYGPGDPAPVMVKDTLPGVNGVWHNFGLTVVGSRIIYFAQNGNNVEVWAANGQTVENIFNSQGSGASWYLPSTREVSSSGRELYFAVNTSDQRPGLYRTDGTRAGTAAVPNSPGLSVKQITLVRDSVYFIVAPNFNSFALWKVSSKGASAEFVTELQGQTVLSELNGKLVFPARHNSMDRTVLWSSDGTASGTKPTGELPTGYAVSGLQLVKMAGRVFFLAHLNSSPLLLMSSDTSGNIRQEAVLEPVHNYGSSLLSAFGTTLLFAANGSEGVEPYAYTLDLPNKVYLPALRR